MHLHPLQKHPKTAETLDIVGSRNPQIHFNPHCLGAPNRPRRRAPDVGVRRPARAGEPSGG